ncbi:MAG TPA: hypothetical protein VKZ18_24865 [Polyangia bacterium]|nr:hypothetical protein [Polyangia bacterium]
MPDDPNPISDPASPQPKRYRPRLEPVDLAVSDIACECYVWPVPRTQAHAGLIVFSGTYAHGSAGALDALQIKWRINQLCQLPPPIGGLVVDLRQLAYEWGDDLSVEPDKYDLSERLLVVVRPEQVQPFKYPIGASRLRTDIEQAFAEIADAVRAKR